MLPHDGTVTAAYSDASDPAMLAGLDDMAIALLLALNFASYQRRCTVWVEDAQRLWGTSFEPEAARAAMATLQAAGFVQLVDDGASVRFSLEPDVCFAVLRDVHAQGRLDAALARLEGPSRSMPSPWDRPHRELGTARALFVLGAPAVAFERVRPFFDRLRGRHWDEPEVAVEVRLLGLDPARDWLEAAPDAVLVAYAKGLGEVCVQQLWPLRVGIFDRLDAVLQGRRVSSAKRNPIALLEAAMLWLPAEHSAALPERRGASGRRKLALLRAFAMGELETAYGLGIEALEAHAPARKALDGITAVAFVLAALDAARRGVVGAWLHVETVVRAGGGYADGTGSALNLLYELYEAEVGQGPAQIELEDAFGSAGQTWSNALVGGLLSRWLELPLPPEAQALLERFAPRVRLLGTPLLPATFDGLTEPGHDPQRSLLGVYASRPRWEHLVEQFEAFADRVAPPVEPTTAEEGFVPSIVWQVEDDPDGALMVSPRLIASPRSHGGRAIRLDEVETTYGHVAEEADLAVLQAYRKVYARVSDPTSSCSLGEGNTRLVFAQAFALIGHPRVRDPSGAPVAVVRALPVLVVDGNDAGARVTIEPAALTDVRAQAHVWDGPQRLALYECDERLGPIFQAVIGLRAGRVPHAALTRLRPTLARLTDVLALQGRGTVDLEAKPLEAESGIEVDLHWRDPTLRIRVCVRPLGPHGPQCLPGEGQAEIVADTGHGLRTTVRALEAEAEALEAVLQACPRLAELEVDDAGGRFIVHFQRACLLLEELTQAAGAGLLTLAWPRGKPLRLSRELQLEDLNIEVRRGRKDWLAVESSLPFDEQQVLAWRRLIEGRGGANRFVRLDDGQVLRLSESLRRTLDALHRLDPGGKDPSCAEIPALLLVATDALFGSTATLAADVAARKAAIEAALQSRVSVPVDLRARLRPYQEVGFTWMMRLANAGLGGVLADDMGLGKTVQSLAMLLARREQGPALVACPTSVLVNWRNEAQRFAPSLEVVDIASLPPSERLGTLEAIEPGGVALMSYGVMQRLGEDAAGLRFATVVFDEVHALKNATTARARAAAQLRADVRFGLTGTPLENNIGELWSVMEACVPGLLGDRTVFSESLGQAVAGGEAWAKRHLDALLQPFILRRTKEAVLRELPPRTEAVVMVEPSKAERAWYEAQRRGAEERIREALEQGKLRKGEASMRLLVEIGRLRQAAIEPRLVEDDAPRGAKLDRVVERCTQLVSAGHQVLVFTQFLGVLAILDDRLSHRGIATLQLDGSTPAAERARRIERFQAGEADVFLMSLRAGGIGVNLTAADYVLHVDPWWNPAVEEQATARAHRMGQTRPVTVYRFCTEGSIEGKILALHDSKRALAEDVLSGMGGRKRLDVEALQALLARW